MPDEFMNSKKSHEVQSMSEVVAGLAQRCGVKQVIDVGSGKGYLSSFLSLQYGLRVYGIDSSTTNTHGAQERNRKLKRFSRAYQKRKKAARAQSDAAQARQQEPTGINPEEASHGGEEGVLSQEEGAISGFTDVGPEAANSEREDFFLHALSEDLVQTATPRLPPSQLGAEEKERRKRENLERKAQNQAAPSAIFSPLTSHVTAETELGELIQELEVGRQLPGLWPVAIDKFHHRSAAPSSRSSHSSPRTMFPVSRKRSWSGCTHAETWRPAPCGCLWPSQSWLQSAAWAAAITCCRSSSARPGRVTTATQTHIHYKSIHTCKTTMKTLFKELFRSGLRGQQFQGSSDHPLCSEGLMGNVVPPGTTSGPIKIAFLAVIVRKYQKYEYCINVLCQLDSIEPQTLYPVNVLILPTHHCLVHVVIFPYKGPSIFMSTAYSKTVKRSIESLENAAKFQSWSSS